MELDLVGNFAYRKSKCLRVVNPEAFWLLQTVGLSPDKRKNIVPEDLRSRAERRASPTLQKLKGCFEKKAEVCTLRKATVMLEEVL